jgi:1,4-alpha-glucan branching enzyme
MSLEKRVSADESKVAVTFRVPSELGAKSADLVGEFTDWKLVAMQPDPDGSLAAEFDLEAGNAYRFRYLVDGERWENDWEADGYVPNDYGGDDSVVDIRRSARPPARRLDGLTATPKLASAR